MKRKSVDISKRQVFFRETVLGTLLYSVVLGMFNDYTAIVQIDSYSTLFLLSFVLQLLTYGTLYVKGRISHKLGRKADSFAAKTWRIVAVWLVLFVSKFVFLWVIEIFFGSAVHISSFVGLIVLIVTMTAAKQLIDIVFYRLAD